MPTYDPKANRPNLVPVDGDAAPVDALLGPAPAEPPAPPRHHLTVVPDDGTAPKPAAPAPAPAPARKMPVVALVAAALAVTAAVAAVVVLRHRD